MKNILLYYILY